MCAHKGPLHVAWGHCGPSPLGCMAGTWHGWVCAGIMGCTARGTCALLHVWVSCPGLRAQPSRWEQRISHGSDGRACHKLARTACAQAQAIPCLRVLLATSSAVSPCLWLYMAALHSAGGLSLRHSDQRSAMSGCAGLRLHGFPAGEGAFALVEQCEYRPTPESAPQVVGGACLCSRFWPLNRPLGIWSWLFLIPTPGVMHVPPAAWMYKSYPGTSPSPPQPFPWVRPCTRESCMTLTMQHALF